MYCHCGEESLVCVGAERTPLCVEHFQEYLRNINKNIKRFGGLLSPRK